ncbi:hypothetical protein [Polaribacter dokdonensis]|uniref:Uncharacterized protein n=1 Tax=Polaribacter dokdonensis DSW-5 TaxID=1300348 RepID=A0A0N0CFC7_9FLAO|nr:hypothetical protein [Polaribacter dokdonensis]KOY51700.1 hypothetical protein I602_1260 [Polaribacter dokdonensis DSW-5]SEE05221.1 hypothetical protein SAMN05444353_0511 [Polaribacter dokdonensis DSW-5]
MKKCLLLFCVLSSINCFSQFIDGNKDVIFQLDKAESSQLKFNGNELSFEGNYLRLLRFYKVEADTSAVKVDVVGFKIGLTNESKILDVSKISDFGFSAETSYKWTLRDSIYSNRSVFTGRIGVRFQVDKFKLYDPLTSEIGNESPSQFSLVGNLTRYFKNYKFAIAVNGSYNLHSYNKDELLNYKKNSDIIQDNNVTAFKDFDGKYGTIRDDLEGGRLSLSVPIFFSNRILNWSRAPYVILAPYFATRFVNGSNPSQNTGLSMNFLREKAFSDNKYNLPSSLGLGFDWGYKNGSWSSMNLFLSGSITFD